MRQPYVPVACLNPQGLALVRKYRVEVVTDRCLSAYERDDEFTTGTTVVGNDTLLWILIEHNPEPGVNFHFFNLGGLASVENYTEVREAILAALFAVSAFSGGRWHHTTAEQRRAAAQEYASWHTPQREFPVEEAR